jgi:nucleoside-diphosphate-sugar epimerase
MKIFVTGACGYKGTVLVPKRLACGHESVAFDIMWFGNHLKPHPRPKVVQGDVRDIDTINLDGIDASVHPSSIANDPCWDLDPKLTWEVSALATMQLADKIAKRSHDVRLSGR